MISKRFLASVEEKLKEEKNKLLVYLSEIAKKNEGTNQYEATLPEYGRAEDENAEEVADYADALSQKEDIEENLKEIDHTLEKIKQGLYGICEKCQKKISAQRLEALPTARYCLKCKREV